MSKFVVEDTNYIQNVATDK